MKRRGGLKGGRIGENPVKEPDVKLNAPDIKLAKNPDGTRADNLNVGDIITIFDTETTYASAVDTACVMALDTVSDSRWVKVTLGDVATCTQPYIIQNPLGYDGSVPNGTVWDFTIGKSAGVCVEDAGFYKADTSQLNKRNTTGPFDDAFVSFKIPAGTVWGQSIVPYLPSSFFDGYQDAGGCVIQARQNYDFDAWYRFAGKWFTHKNPTQANWLQAIGVVDAAQLGNCTVYSGTFPRPQLWGQTKRDSITNISFRQLFVFRGGIEYPCKTPSEQDNATRETTSHEIGHNFYVNPTRPERHDDHCWWKVTGSTCNLGTCTNANDACVMNVSNFNPWDSINRFDTQDLRCGDPGCPNGVPGCCTGSGCSLEGNGGIRVLSDPLKGQPPI